MRELTSKQHGENAPENPWQGRRVLIVGMARSGIAAAQLLCREGACAPPAERLEDVRV